MSHVLELETYTTCELYVTQRKCHMFLSWKMYMTCKLSRDLNGQEMSVQM